MEASVSVKDIKSYHSYSIKHRGVYQIFSVSDAAFISKSDFWIHHWCSSVSKDYGVVLWLVVLEQRLVTVWLERPILEW